VLAITFNNEDIFMVDGSEIIPNKKAYYQKKIAANASHGNSMGKAIDMDVNLIGILIVGISESKIVNFGSEIKKPRLDELMKESEKLRRKIKNTIG